MLCHISFLLFHSFIFFCVVISFAFIANRKKTIENQTPNEWTDEYSVPAWVCNL